jgi:hypothetical protein
MDTQTVADRLAELSRTGQFKLAQDELYASDAVSVEPEGSFWPTVEGIEALNAKVAKWEEMVEEVHGIDVTAPLVSGNYFTCVMSFDLTLQGQGRTQGTEVAVFHVKDGRIVLEHFFYEP